jgi:hypothetical protein
MWRDDIHDDLRLAFCADRLFHDVAESNVDPLVGADDDNHRLQWPPCEEYLFSASNSIELILQ